MTPGVDDARGPAETGDVSHLIRQFADRLTDPACLLTPTGKIEYANPAFLEEIGRSVDPADFIHPEDFAVWQTAVTEALGGLTMVATTRIHKPSKVPMVMRWEFFPMGESLAAVLRYASPTRDREASLLFSAIVQSSEDVIVSKTLDGIVTSWNPAAVRTFGYTQEEMIGQSIMKIIPADRQYEEVYIQETLRKGGRVDHFHTWRQRKDGSLVEVSVTVSPIFDADGRVIGASKIARDITLQRREVELSANLAAIIESSDDAIVGKTLQSIVTSWNPGAERIFGYSAQEMIGQSITKLIPPDRQNEEDEIIDQLRRGAKVDHFETTRLTKDGRLIDVSVTVSPIRDHKGEIVGASKVARVITERKLAELALKESERHLRGLTELLEQRVQDRTADLQAALREMEGFTYTISHDLRAPLRAIIANCRILEEDYAQVLPVQAHRHLERQAEAAGRLATLIDDLLRLSRIGRQALHKVDVDISTMAEEIIEELRQRSPAAAFVVAPNLKAKADPLLLRLALANLLENSVKFVRPDNPPVVELGVEEDTFFVRDNGIGFDQAYVEKIFLPFERLHRDADFPGTGIGLANVRRIVERHGGKVWAVGTPGKGATFSFRLPLEDSPAGKGEAG